MKEEIKKILDQTFAYNVENDKVAQELLDLFSVSGSLPDTKGDKIRKHINPTNHFIDWLIDNGQPQFKELYDKLQQYAEECYGNDR